MSRSYEVEYCNLELRFDRRLIQRLITSLIEEGYSLYWKEYDSQFIIAVRSGRKLVKLRFNRFMNRYQLVGTYTLKDDKLAQLLERFINETRGHAVVKRFHDRQILIENIVFGEIIKTVQITGLERKVLFKKEPMVSMKAVEEAWRSPRIEQRLAVLRLEIDYELAVLHELLHTEAEKERIDACKSRLAELTEEWKKLQN